MSWKRREEDAKRKRKKSRRGKVRAKEGQSSSWERGGGDGEWGNSWKTAYRLRLETITLSSGRIICIYCSSGVLVIVIN